MISKALFTHNSDEWYTPHDFFQKCSDEVGGFFLDPCSSHENHKTPVYFTKEDDGLSKEWFGKVFVNPPYSAISKWAEKCHTEMMRGGYRLYIFLFQLVQILDIFTIFSIKKTE